MSSQTNSIPFAMLAVFGVAKLLAELFDRLRQPAIIGEILAGAIIGPSLLAAAFTLVVAAWGSPTVKRMFPHVRHRFRAGEVEFNLALIALCGLALAASYAGVPAIVGAFLAGMACPEHRCPAGS